MHSIEQEIGEHPQSDGMRRHNQCTKLLKDNCPPKRVLSPAERNEVWRHVKDRPELLSFRTDGIERFLGTHGALLDGRALVVFNGLPADDKRPPLFNAWPNRFDCMLRIYLPLRSGLKQVSLLPGDAAWEALRSDGRVVFIHVRMGKIEAAAEYAFRATPVLAEALDDLLTLTEQAHREKLDNTQSHYYDRDLSVADSLRLMLKQFTRSDWLQSGWVEACHQRLHRLTWMIGTASTLVPNALSCPPVADHRLVTEAMEILVRETDNRARLKALFDFFSDAKTVFSFFEQSIQLSEALAPDVPLADDIQGVMYTLFQVMHAVELLPKISDWGRRQAYLDGYEYRCQPYVLDPLAFPIDKDEQAQDYWPSVTAHLPYDGAYYLTGGDLPESAEAIKTAWAAHTVEVDTQAAMETTDHLLDEAMALRKWTIPARAVVDIQVGPFVSVELTEICDEVHFVWRTASGRFWLTSVGVKGHTFFKTEMGHKPGHGGAIEAETKLLMAAMVRDFWVAEERRKVFDVRVERHKGTGTGKAGKRTVVYLPRIRYISSGLRFDRLTEGLEHSQRARHYVRSFFRKVENPSPLQLEIARCERITVPEGHTYVRGHYRGGGEKQAVYRSRSALQLIYDTIDRPEIEAVRPMSEDWFAFERAIAVLMEDHLGFTIIHRAVRGKGDDGVDVMATKTVRGLSELWLVQCKHYGPDNPVGPGVIREMLGSMADAQPEEGQVVRGMVVTTGRFSPDALRLAAKHGIIVHDGDALTAIASSVNRQALTVH